MANRLDFKHEVCTPDNESSFEVFRNEDPFSFALDVKITTTTETLELFHLSHNQTMNKYREWRAKHNCKIIAFEQDNEK